MRYARTEARFYEVTRRRLEATLARSRAIVERSRRAIERCDALMVEAAERFGPRSSPDPLLHPLGEREQVAALELGPGRAELGGRLEARLADDRLLSAHVARLAGILEPYTVHALQDLDEAALRLQPDRLAPLRASKRRPGLDPVEALKVVRTAGNPTRTFLAGRSPCLPYCRRVDEGARQAGCDDMRENVAIGKADREGSMTEGSRRVDGTIRAHVHGEDGNG